jgi:hypothetical protein
MLWDLFVLRSIIFKSTADMLSTSTNYASVCLSICIWRSLNLNLRLKISLEYSGMIQNTV